MNLQQKLIDTHLRSLSAHYADQLNGMQFAAPVIEDADTVVSISHVHQEAYLTRHYAHGHHLDAHPTHVLILIGTAFNRALKSDAQKQL